MPPAGGSAALVAVPAGPRGARGARWAKGSDKEKLGGGAGGGAFLASRRCWPPRRCDDQVPLEPDQLGRQVGQPVDPTLRISIVDDNILALNPPELAQPLPERVEVGRPVGRGRHPKETYPRHLSRLLRVGGERHGEKGEGEDDCERIAYDPHAATA